MSDRRDNQLEELEKKFKQLLLGVFCGQIAACPVTAKLSRTHFISFLRVLFPQNEANDLERVLVEMITHHSAELRRQFRGSSRSGTATARVANTSGFWLNGYFLGFLLGRGIDHRFDLELPLSAVRHEGKPFSGGDLVRVLGHLQLQGEIVTVRTGQSLPQSTFSFTPAVRERLHLTRRLQQTPLSVVR